MPRWAVHQCCSQLVLPNWRVRYALINFCGKNGDNSNSNGCYFRESITTYLEHAECEKVKIGKLAELLEQIQWNEGPPCVLSRAHFIVREALLRVQTVIVDHKISRVGARYHLVLVVAADFGRPGLVVFDLRLIYRIYRINRQAALRIGV